MAAKLKEMDDIVRTMHLKATVDHTNDQGQTLLVSTFGPFTFYRSKDLIWVSYTDSSQ